MLKKLFITSTFVLGMAPFAAHAGNCDKCANGCDCGEVCDCESDCDCPDC